MAAASGLSCSSIQRIWQAHQLKPHRVKTFKLSNDERFAEKVQDIIGLYLSIRRIGCWFTRSTKRGRLRHLTTPSPACR
jgi:hypothetical protein